MSKLPNRGFQTRYKDREWVAVRPEEMNVMGQKAWKV